MKYDLYINGQVADTETINHEDLNRVMTCFMLIGWGDVVGKHDILEDKPHVELVSSLEKRTSILGNLFARFYLLCQGIVFSVQTMFR